MRAGGRWVPAVMVLTVEVVWRDGSPGAEYRQTPVGGSPRRSTRGSKPRRAGRPERLSRAARSQVPEARGL
jgi:hypothetical protein